jgi:hypothetical protein
MESARNLSGSWKLTLPVICATAACVVLPFLHYGIPSGHDFEVHLNRWMEVVDHWKQGVLYPHWAAMAHYGYGEAWFIFYPPVSWTLGAVLGVLLPWKLVPAAYIWIALTLSGCSMFVLARRWLPAGDALWVAVFYAANPYHLIIVYWRSAMAELLAAAYLPLLLLFILRSDEDAPRAVAPLSLLLAAAWLTNIPSAVMMNYSFALLILWLAVSRRSVAVIGYGALAAALGTAIAAFYLLPVFHQQSWVNIAQVLGPGLRPEDSFLFATTGDHDHDRFNLMVSIVASAETIILAAALFFSSRWQNRRLWWSLLTWSAACGVLMNRPTLPLWARLPELRLVQFPWRWLLCLNVPFALTIVMTARRWWVRGSLYAAALGVVLVVGNVVQHPWWDTAADIQEMADNQHDGPGYEGTDEYVPSGADRYEIDEKAPEARFAGEGKARLQVKKWDVESRLLLADTNAPGELVLRLFNYPLWRVRVNGSAVSTRTITPSGQMVVPIPAGESRVDIDFVEGRDRMLGTVISCVTLLTIVTWATFTRRGLRPVA